MNTGLPMDAPIMAGDPAVQYIHERVNNLEERITDGLDRIEALLRQQIQDIKKEQLSDLKDDYDRLADDQRRLWDAVRDLEKREHRRDGGLSVAKSAWTLVVATCGGGLVALVNWLVGHH